MLHCSPYQCTFILPYIRYQVRRTQVKARNIPSFCVLFSLYHFSSVCDARADKMKLQRLRVRKKAAISNIYLKISNWFLFFDMMKWVLMSVLIPVATPFKIFGFDFNRLTNLRHQTKPSYRPPPPSIQQTYQQPEVAPSYLEHTTLRYYDRQYYETEHTDQQPQINEVQQYETSTHGRPRYVPSSQENPYNTYQQVLVRKHLYLAS